MNCTHYPPRTRNTDLSDDELLLFDMMFDGNASASQLCSTVYSLHLNCDYSHSLDETALLETLNSLLSRRLIVRSGAPLNSDETRYALSDEGGRLWDLERKPNWNVTFQLPETTWPLPKWVNHRLLPRPAFGTKMPRCHVRAGLVTPCGPIRTRSMFDKRLLPWKNFSHVYVLRCPNIGRRSKLTKTIEWDVYESSRCGGGRSANWSRFGDDPIPIRCTSRPTHVINIPLLPAALAANLNDVMARICWRLSDRHRYASGATRSVRTMGLLFRERQREARLAIC